MTSKVDIQRNRLIHLENTFVMYGVCNAETLEKLFAGHITQAYKYYSQMHGDCGIQHYAMNIMLYLRMIKD